MESPCLESESDYLLSQYKFTRKFVLRCTVRNRINNRLINTAQQRLKTHQTHTTCYYRSIKKWMFTKASVMRVPAGYLGYPSGTDGCAVRTYLRTYHASFMSRKAVCFIRARLLASWCFGPGQPHRVISGLIRERYVSLTDS